MLRIEYDKIIAYHPYRKDQPWELGGVRILHVDGVNGPRSSDDVHAEIRRVEGALRQRAIEAGIDARPDNHYGYTLQATCDGLPITYQVRFSDGCLYVWLMPGHAVPTLPTVPTEVLALMMAEAYHNDASGRSWYDEGANGQVRWHGAAVRLQEAIRRLGRSP